METRILLVDDHEIVRKGIRELLRVRSDWNVCGEAANGKEAIEKLLSLQPDLVVMDISMPIMNGIEAAKQIRRLAPSTKIVILSMHDSPQIEEQAKHAGADAFLVKSGAVESLVATINILLREKSQDPPLPD
jgi:DNA-binding NarL/FixJ family response regulator